MRRVLELELVDVQICAQVGAVDRAARKRTANCNGVLDALTASAIDGIEVLIERVVGEDAAGSLSEVDGSAAELGICAAAAAECRVHDAIRRATRRKEDRAALNASEATGVNVDAEAS